MNAEEDITDGGVQAILLVEDSIRFYSTYLPELYKLILLQNTEFLKDAFNEQQQILRKRARPKILLATNYEEAVELYDRYKKNILGVISDVGFVLHRERPARERETRRGHRPLPPHQGRQPADARPAAIVADRVRGTGPPARGGVHRQEFQNAAHAAARIYRQGVRLRRIPLQRPRYGCRHRQGQRPGADAGDDRHDPRQGIRISHVAKPPFEMALFPGGCSRWRRRSAGATRANSRRPRNIASASSTSSRITARCSGRA